LPAFRSLAGGSRRRRERAVPPTPPSLKVHGHFFENSGHGESVLRCISEGVLPLRYAYAGSAAYTHDRLAGSDDYRSVIGSVELELRAFGSDGFPSAALSRVVEIGPGNGVHTVALLRSLAARGQPTRSYLGLDFSATLLGLACERIREAFGGKVSLQSAVWDMEAGPSARIERWRVGLGRDGPVVACLLGHTLGNVDSGEQVLGNIHRSLRAGDVLAVGVTLRPHGDDHAAVLAPYQTDAFRAAAIEPLRAAGIAADDLDFGVHYADGAVIGEAVFVRKVRVGPMLVPAGHVLHCFFSRRFALSEVLTMLERTGFQLRTAVADDAREHAVVIAAHAA
jgi:L-histidine Nalpha-methyltransferase